MKLLFALLLIVGIHNAIAQNFSGIIKDSATLEPLEYVNIGIKGKNIGTVSDLSGKFNIYLPSASDNDTLIVSRIGYSPFKTKVSEFKKLTLHDVLLQQKNHDLKELTIRPKKMVTKILGNTSQSKMVQLGFAENVSTGYECGVSIKTKKPALAKKIFINIASCTYDSIFYRLNIYNMASGSEFENILSQPIFISLSKADIDNQIVIDIEKKGIMLEGEYLISLENVKDLGPGHLFFCGGLASSTFFRKTSHGSWESVSFGVSISLEVEMEK
jgi:hypothetical protein